jgi:hypothetical protein
MVEPEHRLHVLIANERDDRLERISAIVEGLGHEIVARPRYRGCRATQSKHRR